MGKLYCVCDRAKISVCDNCPKGMVIRPDHTANYALWRREEMDRYINKLKLTEKFYNERNN